jgi:hypothetical protein
VHLSGQKNMRGLCGHLIWEEILINEKNRSFSQQIDVSHDGKVVAIGITTEVNKTFTSSIALLVGATGAVLRTYPCQIGCTVLFLPCLFGC